MTDNLEEALGRYYDKKSNAKQHADACKSVKHHIEKLGYRQRRNLSVVAGRADFTVWGQGAVTLELEIKTGRGYQSAGQKVEQRAIDARGALYRVATVNKSGSRYDMAEVDAALAEMDRLNEMLRRLLETPITIGTAITSAMVR
ncbi:MAG: hypothetical protein PHE17_19335 [Thiothrix sp.]|jgi:hypothetical protein|uniref:hypothetical protein n=1 Tax=Thiothrix sp. TaxID=1032 RepID=UPI00262F3E2B|nr:hypothetical protein [Thiothrix sp.]MDD5395181.1 hypothetical protein [Thiothrix sp.]